MSDKAWRVLGPERTIKTRKTRVQVNMPVVVKGVDFQGNPFREAAESVNFSASGICFLLERRVRVGSMLELLISVPPDMKTYKTMGQVTRVEDGRRPKEYKFGVRFTRDKTFGWLRKAHAQAEKTKSNHDELPD